MNVQASTSPPTSGRPSIAGIGAALFGPSAVLLPVLALYLRFEGTPHFVLHTLAGWDLALTLLLLATYRGWGRSRWDGLLLLALALWALTPDFIYIAGPPHRDWMDLFLFHIALDEILPFAAPALIVLAAVLLRGYLRFRAGQAPATARARRQLKLLLTASAISLIALVASGVVVERRARTPLVSTGQPAPEFSLEATDGRTFSLAEARGQPVILAFVPSVICEFCREQLRALQQAWPELRRGGVLLVVVSTDQGAVQQAVAERLGLEFPILSEAPTVDQHPVGSAYGVYHLPQPHPGPVNANAIVVIDAEGIVRAVRLQAGQAMTADEVFALVRAGLGRL